MSQQTNPRTVRQPGARWTNASVLALAQGSDPVQAVTELARQIAVEAMDQGWAGPPFDPIALAESRGIEVVANSEIRDARTVPGGRGKSRIEFNPDRPRGRMRYSIAHEIAHTLFPDVSERIRNRAVHAELSGDDWQLEAMCNIAAAEFLMPSGSLPKDRPEEGTISDILALQREFDVSTEALVIRLAETSEASVAAFCASPRREADLSGYALDYVIGSHSWGGRHSRSTALPQNSVVRQCTAIGFSARGVETWWTERGPMEIEAVGIPPYPGGSVPRVVGLLKIPRLDSRMQPCIEFLFGSATQPRGEGPKLVVQIVNDKTPNWGGGGFARAVRRAWPHVQEDFREWAAREPASFKLGAVRFAEADHETLVASVVAQHGYGASKKPRVRYAALRSGLAEVGRVAADCSASVHMPRIGTGQAGGHWSIVQDLIAESLCALEVSVTVYDLPKTGPHVEMQTSLGLPPTKP